MNQEDVKLIVAVISILIGGYQFITKPLTAKIEAENAKLETKLKDEIHLMEKRINERIDAWIVRK